MSGSKVFVHCSRLPRRLCLTTYRKDGSANVSPVWFRWVERSVRGRHYRRRREAPPPGARSTVCFPRLRGGATLPRRRGPRHGELVECDVTPLRADIAGRYLGASEGERFAAERDRSRESCSGWLRPSRASGTYRRSCRSSSTPASLRLGEARLARAREPGCGIHSPRWSRAAFATRSRAGASGSCGSATDGARARAGLAGRGRNEAPLGGAGSPARTVADGASRSGADFVPDLVRRIRRHSPGTPDGLQRRSPRPLVVHAVPAGARAGPRARAVGRGRHLRRAGGARRPTARGPGGRHVLRREPVLALRCPAIGSSPRTASAATAPAGVEAEAPAARTRGRRALMPLSADVRAELAAIAPLRRCDRLAELSALFHSAGTIHFLGRGRVALHLDVASSGGCAARLRAAARARRRMQRSGRIRGMRSTARRGTSSTSTATKGARGTRRGRRRSTARCRPLERPPRRVVARACCRGAYLRGAFLGGGSLSGPRSPHLELRTTSREGAVFLAAVAERSGAMLGVAERTSHALAYAKGWDSIEAVLAAAGARRSRARARGARSRGRGSRAGEPARQRRPREPRPYEPGRQAQLEAAPATAGARAARRPAAAAARGRRAAPAPPDAGAARARRASRAAREQGRDAAPARPRRRAGRIVAVVASRAAARLILRLGGLALPGGGSRPRLPSGAGARSGVGDRPRSSRPCPPSVFARSLGFATRESQARESLKASACGGRCRLVCRRCPAHPQVGIRRFANPDPREP